MGLNNFISIFYFKKIIFGLLWNSCPKQQTLKSKDYLLSFKGDHFEENNWITKYDYSTFFW